MTVWGKSTWFSPLPIENRQRSVARACSIASALAIARLPWGPGSCSSAIRPASGRRLVLGITSGPLPAPVVISHRLGDPDGRLTADTGPVHGQRELGHQLLPVGSRAGFGARPAFKRDGKGEVGQDVVPMRWYVVHAE